MEEIILQTTKDLFSQLGIKPEVSVTHDPESEYYTIQIETDNPGLLIGYRGETMSALQLIIGQLVKHQSGDWLKLIVNVGNYREQRQETLKQLAINAAKRVEFYKEPYIFTNLTPPERRIVHMVLQDHPNITTKSEGEGRNRQLIIIPN